MADHSVEMGKSINGPVFPSEHVYIVFSMTPFIRFLLLDCYVIMSCVFNCLVPRPSLHCFTLLCGGSAALVPALWQFIQSELLKQMCMCSPNYNVYVFYIMWTGRFVFKISCFVRIRPKFMRDLKGEHEWIVMGID